MFNLEKEIEKFLCDPVLSDFYVVYSFNDKFSDNVFISNGKVVFKFSFDSREKTIDIVVLREASVINTMAEFSPNNVVNAIFYLSVIFPDEAECLKKIYVDFERYLRDFFEIFIGNIDILNYFDEDVFIKAHELRKIRL